MPEVLRGGLDALPGVQEEHHAHGVLLLLVRAVGVPVTIPPDLRRLMPSVASTAPVDPRNYL
ncbi:hypothetical protein JCM4814A_76320 [Streptomyces phaeofaciens JCM 4814]|uniref:Uncharacterized protein n=1 Tax=Streptomyces phaeofaciens TaxID=68254 RepID=A0A918M062_9ACTN|nr:hypothetical protein GCM10010226_74950 [Streptomyces phaeofaciens]